MEPDDTFIHGRVDLAEANLLVDSNSFLSEVLIVNASMLSSNVHLSLLPGRLGRYRIVYCFPNDAAPDTYPMDKLIGTEILLVA